jgi:hypothetical protein
MPKPGRYEQMSRRHLEGTKHRKIANAFLAQRFDEALSGATQLAASVAAAVTVYSSRHQVAASSSTP